MSTPSVIGPIGYNADVAPGEGIARHAAFITNLPFYPRIGHQLLPFIGALLSIVLILALG